MLQQLQLAAAQAGEIEKDDPHEDDFITAGDQFFPVVVETLGYCTLSNLKTLKTITSKMTTCSAASFSHKHSRTSRSNSHSKCGISMPPWHITAYSFTDSLWDLPTYLYGVLHTAGKKFKIKIH